ncbi:NAD(P)-dependent oxidoreductase [Cryobacterium sp. PH31-O1]|uniref:NAD-dependent epimerase/dehydratase family protein n=1 Tax=Cryobacterium sp. PH31-O1 TaxID=3046306 RepID=UPI0024BB3966|nr:NAD(P)-dependent oxidoreductase [Cryobacterium sp. PH31-O1]MDJ0339056.1 NAD(P)-dependent oxidoreductase [Cryobacterium sp. PH31-O1]
MNSQRIALTGAAGSLAADIIPGLLARGHSIVGIDQRLPADTFGCEFVDCQVNDREALLEALRGCDAVIHLAGIPLEAEWADIMRANIDGTQAVLYAAQRLGIRRVVLASSIHSAGFVPVPTDGTLVPDDVGVRPNTFYGVSKAAVEALGSLYHDRYGLDVICLRIASRFAEPTGERTLSTWLSPADAVRLFDACLQTENPGFRTIWGVSANTRGYLSAEGGAAIGFRPVDDSERFAERMFAASDTDPSLLASDWDRAYIGGVFSSVHPPLFGETTTDRNNND